MGTFVISLPGLVTTNSGHGTGWGGTGIGADIARPTDDAHLILGIEHNDVIGGLYAGWVSGDGNPVGTWIIQFAFNLSDSIIALDGGAPISFFGLPSGAQIDSATLKISVARYPNASGEVASGLFFRQGLTTESGDLVQVNSLIPVTKQFAYTSPNFLDVVSDGFGIRVIFTINGAVGQAFANARIEGNYSIIAGSWTIDNSHSYQIGQQVTVTGTLLDGVNKVKLTYEDPVTHVKKTKEIDKVDFVTQTATLLIFIFIIDDLDFEGDVSVFFVGNGVQFSGTVPAGFLAILIEDGSGLYRLVTNKTNDTIYISSHGSPDTEDVKIPDPFFKTGYIGG